MNNLVFVYGSLKNGFGNHGILEEAKFLHSTKTKSESFQMISLTSFPAVLNEGINAIAGELYEVDAYTMFFLDILEGNGEFYQRIQVELESGHTAWMYCLLPEYQINEDGNRVLTENRVQTWMLPANDTIDLVKTKSILVEVPPDV